MENLFGGGQQSVAPPPPPAPPAPVPTVDDARKRRESMDAQTRKRGYASTVVTGADGVGATPVQAKTLFGS